VHEQRLADAAGERGRHVPCTDKAELHRAGSLSGSPGTDGCAPGIARRLPNVSSG
jgi:hypothetical protein